MSVTWITQTFHKAFPFCLPQDSIDNTMVTRVVRLPKSFCDAIGGQVSICSDRTLKRNFLIDYAKMFFFKKAMCPRKEDTQTGGGGAWRLEESSTPTATFARTPP
jgi:hypothetical protein